MQNHTSPGALLAQPGCNSIDLTSSIQSSLETFKKNFILELDNYVIGQDEAKQAIVDTIITGLYNVHREQGVIGAVFLGGPSGVGKTELARAVARVLLGNPDGFVKIPGEKFLHQADIAQLYGSSPGYIGYGDVPMLSDERVHAAYNQAKETGKLHPLLSGQYGADNFSIVLVDEVEKAHPSLANAMLNILQSGKAEMSSGKEGGNSSYSKKDITHSRYTDLQNTLFIFTSNVGESEIAGAKEGSMGFVKDSHYDEKGDREIFKSRLKKAFDPAFVNRLKHIIRCHALTPEQLRSVFQVHVERINNTLAEKKYYNGVGLSVTSGYIDHTFASLSAEMKESGARPIARLVDAIGTKIGLALGSGQLPTGAHGQIIFDIEDGTENIRYLPENQLMKLPPAILARSTKQHIQMMVEGKINHHSAQVRETVREYLKHIANYDTGFRDTCRILEKRLRGHGFNTHDINELRASPFCSLYETMVHPENGDILIRDGAEFKPVGFRAIEKYLRSAIKNDFKLQDIYTTITVLLKRPPTQLESVVLAQYIHRLLQSRNTKKA